MQEVKLSHQRKKRNFLSKDEEANTLAINKRVNELKKEFTKKTFNHIGALYLILKEIVKLRHSTDKTYKIRSLEFEEGLNLTGSQIRYIFAYQYITPDTEKKVQQGLILDSSVCHFLAVSNILREPQWQRLLVERIIKGDIKVSQVSELTQDEQKLFLLGKLQERLSDDDLFTATKTIRSVCKRLEERKHLIINSVYRDNLINAIKHLNEIIK